MKCPTCGRMPKRSTQANRLYWAWIHAISAKIHPEGKSYSPESFHRYFKGLFLGLEAVSTPFKGEVLYPVSSAELSTAEFAQFTEQVIAWAVNHGVWIDEELEAA